MTAGALSRRQAKALAKTEQPIFLIGGGRFSRRSAANAVHREMIGAEMDVDSPHPDLAVLTPPVRADANVGKSIGIDAAKSFVSRLTLTPYAASVRVGFIEPGSALTLESQNALLRYVEEPTRTSRVMISSRRAEDLLPTLLSRCLAVRLPAAPDPEEAAYLSECHGEPEETIKKLYDILDDPDAVEKILDFRLAKPALELHAAISRGSAPRLKITDAFMEKKPAQESSFLFVEIVLSAVCARLKETGSSRGLLSKLLAVARQLLVLQSELRYNPQRQFVFSAVLEWLEDLQR